MRVEQGLTNESIKAGLLRVHPGNPRYFTDGSGKAIYLTGSNTWNALTDARFPLDYDAYLDFLVEHNHNIMKFRAWDSNLQFEPLYYKRTGPGLAMDGGLKLDLNQFDQAYFDRMRQRAIAAGQRGIYVMIMLFETDEPNGDPALSDPYSADMDHHECPRRWNYHPYNKLNNINGIDGGNADNSAHAWTETLTHPGITALREACIRKVVDTVNDLDNVLYEIANESFNYKPGSTNVSYGWWDIPKEAYADPEPEWSYHMVDYIHHYESTKPKQHPVIMTPINDPWSTEVPLASNAEGISPGMTPPSLAYLNDPPAADGSKVILNDPDHYGWTKLRGSRAWAWKSFTRGLNPIPLDSLPISIQGNNGGGWGGGEMPDVVECRSAMGHTRTYAEKMNLAAMIPRNDLSSTMYCLANPGSEYLVYQPCSGSFSVNLMQGTYVYEWFDARAGIVAESGSLTVPGGELSFSPPISFADDAVLYLKSGSL